MMDRYRKSRRRITGSEKLMNVSVKNITCDMIDKQTDKLTKPAITYRDILYRQVIVRQSNSLRSSSQYEAMLTLLRKS